MNRRWFTLLMAFLLFAVGTGMVSAEEEEMKVLLQPHVIQPESQAPIEIEDAPLRNPGDGSDPTGRDGHNPDPSNPDGINPDDPNNPGGINPEDPNNPGGINYEDPNRPGEVNSENGDNRDPRDPGNINDETRDPDNIDGENPNGGNIDSSNRGQDGIDAGKVNGDSPDGKNDGNSNEKKSWKDRLLEGIKSKAADAWDTIKDVGKKVVRGVASGGLGAALVVGAVVGVAALIGVTVAAPVIIAGLVVGVAAGVVYSFASGDDFSFFKGVAVGGIGALAGMGLAKIGALGGAVRAGFSAVRNGFQLFKQAPLTFLKGHVFNTGVYLNFGASFAWNMADYYMRKGSPPGLKDFGGIVASSALSAVVFGKLASLASAKRKSWFTKRLSEGGVGVIESVFTNTLKGYPHTAAGYLSGVVGAFLPKPVTNYFKKLREKKQIGTTLTELSQKGIKVEVGKKTLTNKKLNQLWKLEGDQAKQLTDRLKGQISQRQYDQLLKNTKAQEQLLQRKELFGLGEKAVKNELSKHVIKPVIEQGVEQAAELKEQAGQILNQADTQINEWIDSGTDKVDQQVKDWLDVNSPEETLKKTGTTGK